MAITKKQLKKIEEAIRKRFYGFTLEAMGVESLTSDQLRELKRLGIVRKGVLNLKMDSFTFGKVIALLERPASTGLTLSSAMEMIKNPKLALTGVEKKSIEYASEKAGQYIVGIMDTVLKEARTSVAGAKSEALRAVQEGVSEAIANRVSASELKTYLFNKLDDKNRDWHRVAHTEINTSVQNGIYSRIRSESSDGADQLVFKRPAPNACRHCKRLHLMPDGVTPRVFKLSELAETNIGLRPDSWRATVGSVHPWCHCQLSPIPSGYDFKIKNYDKTTKEEIDDSTLPEYKGEVEKLAVLTYTGETAEHTGA